MSQPSRDSTPILSPPPSSQLVTSVSANASKAKIALPKELSTKFEESESFHGLHIDVDSPNCISTARSSRSESVHPEVEPNVTPDTVITPDSPTSTVSVMIKTRAQKRTRQHEPKEGSPPPKKPATRSKAKSKPKPKAKSRATAKAQATAKPTLDEIVTLSKDEANENDELPAKPEAKATPHRGKPPPTNADDDSDSSSAFEKAVMRPKASVTPTSKQPSPNHIVPTSNNEDEPAPPEPPTSAPLPKSKAKRSPKQPTRAAPPPSTRPSRTRKAPERFETLEPQQPTKKPAASKHSSKVFDPMYMTTNSASRLAKADIYHLLLEPHAWTCLSATQQSKLISMLPCSRANDALLEKLRSVACRDEHDHELELGNELGNELENQNQPKLQHKHKHTQAEPTRPSAFTVNNDCFRTDVAKFQEDLKNGHLAKTWLAGAEKAVVERAEGRFDRWKMEEAERWWGQKGKGG